MNRTLHLLYLFIAGLGTAYAQAPFLDPVFGNPALQDINRLPMRASYFPYEDAAKATAGNKEQS